jgi:hypothetical protein
MRLYPHGGARNRADRTSDYLTLEQAQKIIGAIERAATQSLHVNRHIIIHWGKMGVPDDMAMAVISRFLMVFRQWADGETAFVWTREIGKGRKGSHLHLLAHIPDGKKWTGAMTQRWLEQITGNPYADGAIHTSRIMGRKSPDSAYYAANLQTVTAYILKGVCPDGAATLGIAHKAGGRIIGKRCGMSQNIARNRQRCRGVNGNITARYIAYRIDNARASER